jgi:alpha-tubulin suppressor-like RCC1 family protein
MIATFADGSLRACGDNSSGQLGLGNVASDSAACTSLQRVDALWAVPIVQVACGKQHSVALGASGDVYVWGSNSVGMAAAHACELIDIHL